MAGWRSAIRILWMRLSTAIPIIPGCVDLTDLATATVTRVDLASGTLAAVDMASGTVTCYDIVCSD